MSLHGWKLSPAEAISLQRRLAGSVVLSPLAKIPRVITGCDCGINLKANKIAAFMISFSFPELEEIERAIAIRPLEFPYVPGLLSFRECPAYISAFSLLKERPDVLMVDGQGLAHPRRLGLACHLGLYLDIPSFGVAKSLLCGEYERLSKRDGASAPLVHKGEVVGSALRTRKAAKPLFVSAGNRITLPEAEALTLACCDGHRLPVPTRRADALVRETARGL